MQSKKEVIVIGHKNPDTDSICSAIAYANLKNKIDDNFHYVPKRCGDVSKETAFVLNTFDFEEPGKQIDVRTQVSDIEIKQVEGVDGEMSIKKAYMTMKEKEAVTLAVTKEDNSVEGVISMGDIAAADMDVYDSRILSKACTSYKNIVETLDGTLICGDINGVFDGGKVTVAANTPEMMEEFIQSGDLVIMGNRVENQFFAIEIGAKCIVLCMDSKVSGSIKRFAKEKNCTIISSPYDTYTVTRLINRSMPIRYFMTSKNLIKFRIDDFTNDVKEVMAKVRLRYFPVLNEDGDYIGQISKRSFLDMSRKKVILVDHNEKNQAIDGIESANVLEIIDHHKLGSLETMHPVYFRNQPVGCTATIIHAMYMENNVEVTKEIAGLLVAAIISDTLMFRSPTCTLMDKLAAEALAKIAEIEIEEFAKNMFSAGSDFASVTNEDIFYQDYKPFATGGMSFGIGQITAMNNDDLLVLKDRINEYMDEIKGTKSKDMLIFMLTNILDESSILIFKGKKAKQVMESTYGNDFNGDTLYVKGLVSRKKQLVPDLMNALQQ